MTKAKTEWALLRESVALGLTIKEAASKYGVPYEQAKKRAQRERWPTPARLAAARPAQSLALPADVVAASWAERGERHRRTVMSLVERALAAAEVPAPDNWSDLERAVKLGDRAAGLEKATPQVMLAFPSIQSSEDLPFIEG